MQGKRIFNEIEDPYYLKPGEYMKYRDVWFCKCPNGSLGNLGAHTVIEHEDATISVTPSILVKESNDGKNWKELWHGYLTAGFWKEC